MFKSKTLNKIEKDKVLAVIRQKDPQKAADIAKALIEGGLRSIEITTDCPDQCQAIEEITSLEDVVIGAGSIITSEQAQAGIDSGAKFLVTPVLELSLVKYCKGRGIPLIIGASTANEAYESWKYENSIIKIFPVKAMGGSEYIKDILAAMPFLKLMPTSGIQITDFLDYLKAGATSVGMGRSLYSDTNDYRTITQRAKLVSQKLEEYLASFEE